MKRKERWRRPTAQSARWLMCCGHIEFRTSLSRHRASKCVGEIHVGECARTCADVKGNYARIITLRGSWIGAAAVASASSVLPASDRKCFNWFLDELLLSCDKWRRAGDGLSTTGYFHVQKLDAVHLSSETGDGSWMVAGRWSSQRLLHEPTAKPQPGQQPQ